jgi:hypothetical protein
MEEITGPVRIPCRQLFSGISMCHAGDDCRELRRKALAALEAETIPRDRPARSWGGSGSGELCPVCGRTIEPAEMEWELEFAAADGGEAVRAFHLHRRCFAVLQELDESRDAPLPG